MQNVAPTLASALSTNISLGPTRRRPLAIAAAVDGEERRSSRTYEFRRYSTSMYWIEGLATMISEGTTPFQNPRIPKSRYTCAPPARQHRARTRPAGRPRGRAGSGAPAGGRV